MASTKGKTDESRGEKGRLDLLPTSLPDGKGVIVQEERKAKKNGRPTVFTEELADELCSRITEGESLRKICRDDHMPHIATIFNWHRSIDGFLERYTRAKSEQADTNAEIIQDIADRTLKGEYDPSAARVALDAYKWTAAKLKPKKYGDKLDIDSKSEVNHNFKGLTDEQLDQLISKRQN